MKEIVFYEQEDVMSCIIGDKNAGKRLLSQFPEDHSSPATILEIVSLDEKEYPVFWKAVDLLETAEEHMESSNGLHEILADVFRAGIDFATRKK